MNTTTYSQQLVEAQQSLALWKEAERNVATGGKSYSIGDGDMLRKLERATPQEILANIKYYSKEINRLERVLYTGTRRIVHVRCR
jgi:hypothetical protein